MNRLVKFLIYALVFRMVSGANGPQEKGVTYLANDDYLESR